VTVENALMSDTNAMEDQTVETVLMKGTARNQNVYQTSLHAVMDNALPLLTDVTGAMTALTGQMNLVVRRSHADQISSVAAVDSAYH